MHLLDPGSFEYYNVELRSEDSFCYYTDSDMNNTPEVVMPYVVEGNGYSKLVFYGDEGVAICD